MAGNHEGTKSKTKITKNLFRKETSCSSRIFVIFVVPVGFQKEWTPDFQNLSPRSSRWSAAP